MSETASQITPQIVADHGLNEEEYARILNALGREPNLVELGIFSVMWSEHCSYKSSRIHLKKLPTEAPWVICGPGENAGVIDIGEGEGGKKLAAIFKMESHNHPSYIEPYQGAATGVGGLAWAVCAGAVCAWTWTETARASRRAGLPPAPRALPSTTASTALAGRPACASRCCTSGVPRAWGGQAARAPPTGATGVRAQPMMGQPVFSAMRAGLRLR